MWVSPFRYPRIIKYLLLPVAFRSLSRLSSALSAKASTLRSYQLNLLTSGAGCSLHLRLQRQTLRSWFITLASSSFDEVLTRNFLFLVPRFWMSLSFNSLRSIMNLHYLVCIRFYNVPARERKNLFLSCIVQTQVEMVRFELMTPCLQGRCSPN